VEPQEQPGVVLSERTQYLEMAAQRLPQPVVAWVPVAMLKLTGELEVPGEELQVPVMAERASQVMDTPGDRERPGHQVEPNILAAGAAAQWQPVERPQVQLYRIAEASVERVKTSPAYLVLASVSAAL
jgi:hypothetical protein